MLVRQKCDLLWDRRLQYYWCGARLPPFWVTVQPGRGSHTGLDFAGLLVEGLYAPKEDSFCVVALWDARMNLWPYIQPLCLGAVPELATFNILKIK